jgi:hypothetical protein
LFTLAGLLGWLTGGGPANISFTQGETAVEATDGLPRKELSTQGLGIPTKGREAISAVIVEVQQEEPFEPKAGQEPDEQGARSDGTITAALVDSWELLPLFLVATFITTKRTAPMITAYKA